MDGVGHMWTGEGESKTGFSCVRHKCSSIYDVHTEGEGVRLRWTGEGDPATCGRPHRKLKLESSDVTLSSSHAKKFRLWT